MAITGETKTYITYKLREGDLTAEQLAALCAIEFGNIYRDCPKDMSDAEFENALDVLKLCGEHLFYGDVECNPDSSPSLEATVRAADWRGDPVEYKVIARFVNGVNTVLDTPSFQSELVVNIMKRDDGGEENVRSYKGVYHFAFDVEYLTALGFVSEDVLPDGYDYEW